MYHKFIVTHKTKSGETFGNAYIVPDNYDHSSAALKQLFAEARKSFSKLTCHDIEVRTITYSKTYKGCPVICFPVPPNTKRKGWMNLKERPDIAW
jgi:hypothetical protein